MSSLVKQIKNITAITNSVKEFFGGLSNTFAAMFSPTFVAATA